MSTIAKFDEALRILQEATDRDVSAVSLRILTLLHQHPGLHQEAIAERMGVSGAHLSLLLYAMSKTRKKGQGGFDLIEQIIDEDNRRRKKVFLTVAGQNVLKKVSDVCGCEC